MGLGETFSLKKALVLAGAIIAMVIGTGFATGQELIQYYTSYGIWVLGAVAVFAVVFIFYNICFAKVGAEQHFERGTDVYRYYCGRYLGTFFDYYATAFCYMSFFVMAGGVSSTLSQGFGLPTWVGGALLACVVISVVCLGLRRLVDVIGIIGPANIVFFITVGVIVLVIDWQQLAGGLDAINTGSLNGDTSGEGMVQAGGNWFMAGLSYAGFVLLWFASFTTLLGAQNTRANMKVGIVIAAVAISVAIIIVSLAQIANINTGSEGLFVWNAPIPNLILADRIWAGLPVIYAIVVFIGGCGTSIPLLYNSVSRLAKEGTVRFRVLAVVGGIAGVCIGLFFPYSTLVNVVYGLNGYVGAVLLVFMIVRSIRDALERRHG
ncbi:alanine:cation symporter family protein [Adlercreutzia sp. ZJ304]|uniref:YkvI family membrane protein n=1 Tax=Adlercreutzia sp. ZJ304 TaxID=2709791 RepID=UPI0013ED78EC|nr:alanine:cation symporter family protein [Adlercreutzia sp. ZJ304]